MKSGLECTVSAGSANVQEFELGVLDICLYSFRIINRLWILDLKHYNSKPHGYSVYILRECRKSKREQPTIETGLQAHMLIGKRAR